MPAKKAPDGAAPAKITAAHIRRGLRVHFPTGRCAIAFEVAQGTGFSANRHIDAVAMDLWPSHGHSLHAIEIKVDRSDWRRELKDPAKAEQLARFCRFFWVAAPPGIVPITELPAAWGLLEGGENGMRVVKQAEKTAAQAPDLNFLAAIFRAATTRSIEADETRLALAAAMEKQNAAFEDRVAARAEQLSTNNSEDAQNWRTLMTALGIDAKDFRRHVSQWDAERWIATIKAVHSAGVAASYNGLLGLVRTVAEFEKRLADAAEILNAPVDAEAARLLARIGKKGKS